MFLQETRLKAREVENCKYKLGFINCLAVDCAGKSGGITLLWNRDVDLAIKSFSIYHVDAFVKNVGSNKMNWYLTRVYGHPEAHLRYKVWDLIRRLHSSRGEAWLLFSDFNKILNL